LKDLLGGVLGTPLLQNGLKGLLVLELDPSRPRRKARILGQMGFAYDMVKGSEGIFVICRQWGS